MDLAEVHLDTLGHMSGVLIFPKHINLVILIHTKIL